jgi:hypothetical protein
MNIYWKMWSRYWFSYHFLSYWTITFRLNSLTDFQCKILDSQNENHEEHCPLWWDSVESGRRWTTFIICRWRVYVPLKHLYLNILEDNILQLVYRLLNKFHRHSSNRLDIEHEGDKDKKAKLFLGLINYALRHEDICRSGGITAPFLTSALHRDERSASRSCHFTAEQTTPGTHCIGGWIGFIASRNVMENRKKYFPGRESNPVSLVQPLA